MSFAHSAALDFNQSSVDSSFGGLVQRFRRILPPNVALRALNLNDFPIELNYFDSSLPFGLLPPEQPLITNALPKRIREFALGRSCLRQALCDLQYPTTPILTGTMREPLLPQGVSASITHCEAICMAVATQKNTTLQSIGIDCEAYTPLDIALIDYITTPKEQAGYLAAQDNFFETPSTFSKSPTFSKQLWAKLIFSLKESYYKAYFQITGCFLDFLEAEVELDFHQPLAYIRLCNPLKVFDAHPLVGMGCYTITDGYVLSTVTIAHYIQRS